MSWADLFEYGRPAREALAVLARGEADDGLAALHALIGRTVDGNPDAWVLAAHMLPDFTGSVSELLFTATAATG